MRMPMEKSRKTQTYKLSQGYRGTNMELESTGGEEEDVAKNE